MRPHTFSPVHRTGGLAELVCSNSLGSRDSLKAPGILKEELMQLDSLIMESATRTQVPAGQALAVDREKFSSYIEEKITAHERIKVKREEVREIPAEGIVIIATGPITSPAMSSALQGLIGDEYLYFYDAVAPIVSAESLGMERIFPASRYDKGEKEYLNCPLTEGEYELFWKELVKAERVQERDWEERFFEGCLPVEEIASRGKDTLRFGPMKPVGLVEPHSGAQPYAVVQLRQENREATLYNLVGFQTRLKWSEQQRVFSLIPGLEKAEFLRLGVMHRNIYINAPRCLNRRGQLRNHERIFIAGQLSGVEGYMESTASGALCGINGALCAMGRSPVVFPPVTAVGSLLSYITEARAQDFQPMNINFGLFPPLEERIKKRAERNKRMRSRALSALAELRAAMEPHTGSHVTGA